MAGIDVTKIIMIDDRQFSSGNKPCEIYRKLTYCLKTAFAGLNEIYGYSVQINNGAKGGEDEETGVGQNKQGESKAREGSEIKCTVSGVEVYSLDISEKGILSTIANNGGDNSKILILLDVVLNSERDKKETGIRKSIDLFDSLNDKNYKVICYTTGKKDETVKSCLIKEKGRDYYDDVLDVTWYDPIHFTGTVKQMYEKKFNSQAREDKRVTK